MPVRLRRRGGDSARGSTVFERRFASSGQGNLGRAIPSTLTLSSEIRQCGPPQAGKLPDSRGQHKALIGPAGRISGTLWSPRFISSPFVSQFSLHPVRMTDKSQPKAESNVYSQSVRQVRYAGTAFLSCLKTSRISCARYFSCSSAAKCPPLEVTVQRRMSL
jgi:hypothetical protein